MNKVTITWYPNGNLRTVKKKKFDFNNGDAEYKKYRKLEEDFKARNLKAQEDTSENETLRDDTLNITFAVKAFSFTVRCETVFPNYEHVKKLQNLTVRQLNYIDSKYKEMSKGFPSNSEFEELIVEAVKLEKEYLGSLGPRYRVEIKLHKSYTKAHKRAIEYIVSSLTNGEYYKKENMIYVESSSKALKEVFEDLEMSKYYDMEIKEI